MSLMGYNQALKIMIKKIGFLFFLLFISVSFFNCSPIKQAQNGRYSKYKNYSTNVNLTFDDGVYYMERGKYVKAIKKFKIVLANDPYNVAASNNIRRIRVTQTKLSFAIIGVILTAGAVATAAAVSPPSATYSNPNTYSTSSSTSSSSGTNTTRKTQTCGLCNGVGKISNEDIPTFGNTDKKWCDGCQEWVSYSHCHHCETCPSCGGKGYR